MSNLKMLTPELIRVPLTADSKEGVIKELIDLLENANLISDRPTVEKAVLDREKIMSTGMEYGIAIPHGKTDSVSNLITAMGVHPTGIDFDSIDGQLSRIIIITVSPASGTGPHIRFMADISRLLHQEEMRELVLNAKSASDVMAVIGKEA